MLPTPSPDRMCMDMAFTPSLFFRLALTSAIFFSAPVAQAGGFLFQLDNDKIVDTDRHYTNGVRFAYTMDTPPRILAQASETVAHGLGFQSDEPVRTGWVFGQEMYTPENVDTYTPDPLDRPYAGWLYGGISGQTEHKNRQDTYELQLGIVGPESRAGRTQNAIHRALNVSISRGWRSQIGHEVGVLGTRMIKFRTDARNIAGLQQPQYDFIGHGTVQLGNIRTAVALGLTARLGGHLDEDFGPIYGTFALPQRRPQHVTWSFFIGGEGRAVARDIFLDGNSFRNSPDVKKEAYVLETRGGFTVHIPFQENKSITGLQISLNMVQRTREFRTQDKADRYGSLQLTVNF